MSPTLSPLRSRWTARDPRPAQVSHRSVVSAVLACNLVMACATSSTVAPSQAGPATAERTTAEPARLDAAPTAASSARAAAAQGRPVPPSPSRGCGRSSTAAGLQVARAGTLETPYLLTLPEGYDGTRPAPLVFAFHGRTRSHVQMHDTDAGRIAEEIGSKYVVAYVKSIGPGFDHPREQRDNLQIFDALYAHLLGTYCIDSEQVFAMGHSSGGLFSELLACERPTRVRGIAAVAGAMVWPECPGRSAALLVHGERDAVVSISRARAAREHFARVNGCSTDATPIGGAGCVQHTGCEPSLPVEWCEHAEPTYQNTNHGWPSFASAEAARFFASLGRRPHPAGTPLITNESFDGAVEPWQVSFSGTAKGSSAARDGALCATLESAGENPWDAQLSHPGLRLERGRSYILDYRVWTSAPSDVRVKLGLDAAPFTEHWLHNVAASPEPKRVTARIVLAEEAAGSVGLGFQFAGGLVASKLPLTLCVDEVTLTAAPSP